ncbi:MAG TPA: YqjK-like family protein [Candidatus Aquabacterium excrementipullorum]|nr:YqjK-like family protein [Candidatus Aquabacterium excrementipullorum]
MLTDEELALKKRYLQLHSAVLRHTLAQQVSGTLAPVSNAHERVQAVGSWVRRHPVLVAGAALTLVFWRPRGLSLLAERALWAWQTFQRVQSLRGPR